MWHRRLLDYQMRTFIWNYFWISKDFGIIRFFWIIHGRNEGDEWAEGAKGDKGAEGAEGAWTVAGMPISECVRSIINFHQRNQDVDFDMLDFF